MPETVNVTPWLEKLEAAIDLDWEREKLSTWKRLLALSPLGREFPAGASGPGGREPGAWWPKGRLNDALRDPARMLLHELAAAWEIVCRRTAAIPNIRCNYGTSVLPSVLGAEIFWMDDALDTLPTAKPWPVEALGRLLAAGEPDVAAGQGGQVFETAAYFQAALASYPKIREAVWLYHPDLQGPVDVLEMLCGGEMFTAFYDRPEDVKAALALITRTYERFLARWYDLVPECLRGGHSAHWGVLLKGGVMLRDDSLMNLSPEIHAEFVKPFDDRLLARFGGGTIHFCGKADHCVEAMSDSPALAGVHLSQPHLNDMPGVLAALARRGKALYVPKKDCLAGLDLSRGVALI